MLLEAAIGDAYGAAFEYADPEIVENFNTLEYGSRDIPYFVPGRYTDDTQMGIAIAELIISGKPWSKGNIAKKFLLCFKRDPRTGYAGGFYKFLCNTKNRRNFLKYIKPNSDKSGGAMRAFPIGIFSNTKDVLVKSSIQASLTHDTPNGISAAQGSALMTHYFAYNKGPKKELGNYISSLVKAEWKLPWEGPVDSKGMHSVSAAITAVMDCDTMSDLLKKCVAFCGDVDTVATIALAAASFSKEIKQDLPKHLYDGLEDGWQGKMYLEELDRKLIRMIIK